MEESKTLSYDWQYGREELFLRVDSYMSDDNLYIGLSGLYGTAPGRKRNQRVPAGERRSPAGYRGERRTASDPVIN